MAETWLLAVLFGSLAILLLLYVWNPQPDEPAEVRPSPPEVQFQGDDDGWAPTRKCDRCKIVGEPLFRVVREDLCRNCVADLDRLVDPHAARNDPPEDGMLFSIEEANRPWRRSAN